MMDKGGIVRDKRGISAEALLGWVLLAVFFSIALAGFMSPNICDKLLIAVAVFGLLWLFFGSTMLIKTEAAGFVFFLFVTLIILLGWIMLRGTGACDALKQGLNLIPNLPA